MKMPLLLLLLIPHLAFCAKFNLKSSSLHKLELIPEKFVYDGFGCQGKNISPALEWSNPPKGTRSFAITVFDPDAPTGSGWWHWTVVNIPSSVSRLEEGASSNRLPEGSIEGRTDYGKAGYGGPCPPKGQTHHYHFTVWALNTDKLEVNHETPGAQVGFQLHAHSLGKARLVLKYRR